MVKKESLIKAMAFNYSQSIKNYDRNKAEAFFEKIYFSGKIPSYKIPSGTYLARLVLLAGFILSGIFIVRHDAKVNYESTYIREGDIAVVIGDERNFKNLFKSDSDFNGVVKKIKLFDKQEEVVRLVTLRDNLSVLKSPETAANDVCRAIFKQDSVYGVNIKFEFKETKDGRGGLAVACKVTNRGEVEARSYMKYQWLILSAITNMVSIALCVFLNIARFR
jgi:hypothetical protein